MNRAIAIMALALGILAAAVVAVMWFDPVNVALRSALSSTWFTAQQLVILSGAAGFSAVIIGFGIQRIIRAFLIYPEDALYPAAIGIHIRKAENEKHAQVTRAAMKDVNRLNAATMRQLLNPPQDEALLPEDAPLLLPATSSIYSAALPAVPSLLLGVGPGGAAVTLPLRDFGGGIVGGVMGMGKSEAIASMIVGLLRQDASGQGVQLGICDMKGGLDFGRIPGDLAALRWPVAASREAAFAMVSAAWSEIEWRNRLISEAGYSRLEAYNATASKPIPYLFLFVDEMRVLTGPALQPGGDREVKRQSQAFIDQAIKITSLGRAAGVGIIMATQKPSSTSIPTDIRDICGMRLAFYCTTDDASRAVLGERGAEALPYEPGHALLVRGETQQHVRTHLAEIENGAFDRFMGGLSREAVQDAVYRMAEPETPPERGIPPAEPVFVPQDVPPSEEAVKLHIWRTWKRTGSLSATEGALYKSADGSPMKGGIKFYWVREAVEEMERRRGRKLLEAEA